MRIVVEDTEVFSSRVFGGSCLLDYYPTLTTTGVEVKPIGGYYFLLDEERRTNDTCFLSRDELQFVLIKD